MWRSALIWCASAAMASAAGSFDGIYKLSDTADCAAIGQDGGALKIENGIFTGVEVECLMTRPVSVVDMEAKLFTMQCRGEDSQWTERAMFMHSATDGLIIVWNGYAFQYDRCPDPAN